MKRTLALSLLVAALVPGCTAVKTTQHTDYKTSRYANNSVGEPAPPAEGPEVDIPSEGPPDVYRNPAYMPTPLLRSSAAAGP